MMVFEQVDKKNNNESIGITGTRERMQIIADILQYCTENESKSHLMQKANLNSGQVNHYLEKLLTGGLLERITIADEGRRIYRTTEKGRRLIGHYHDMMLLFRDRFNYKKNKNSHGYSNESKNKNNNSPILSRIRRPNKNLAISFLLAVSLSMVVVANSMAITKTTFLFQGQGQQQLAYAQEDVDEDKDKSEGGEGVDTVVIEEDDDSSNGSDDDNNNNGDNDQGGTEDLQREGKGEAESIEEEKQLKSGDREPPDDDCLFDPSLPKCAPIDGECPDGFAMNEDGQCYPNKPCPVGYERRDDDETGTCYPVSEKHLKVVVDVKGVNGTGKISVEAKDGAGDSRIVDNIQGRHTFNFYKNSIPVDTEFKACAYSDKLDKELCAEGKNRPENKPENMIIAFSSNIGLIVIVDVKGADGAGKVSVRSEETGNILGRTVDNIKGKHTFQFKAGEVPIGGEFKACAYSDKLKLELCTTGVNRPELKPEQVSIRFGPDVGLVVIVKVNGTEGHGTISVKSETTGNTLSRTADKIQGTHTLRFEKGQVPVNGEFKACAYSDKLKLELCTTGVNRPELKPEQVSIRFGQQLPPPPNTPPTVTSQQISTDYGKPLPITLNGSDADGDTLSFLIVSEPTSGILDAITSSGPTSASVIYTPNKGYNGSDSFTFKANDGKANSNTAEISITVNPPSLSNSLPIASNQTVITSKNTPVNIILNATDIEDDPLTFSVVEEPSHGSLSNTSADNDNNLTYSPAPDYIGNDKFTFKANDGKADSNIAIVSITINTTVLPTDRSYDMNVLVIKYFPLTADRKNIDSSITGFDITYEQARQKTIDITNNLVTLIAKASTYLGYNDSSGKQRAALHYRIVDTVEHEEAVPLAPIDNRPKYPDYNGIMESHNICSYVDNENVREVWIWAYQENTNPAGYPPSHTLDIYESKMSGPFGDISNSHRLNDMPKCNNTYRVYTYNYHPGIGTFHGLESWGHQMEAELSAVDPNLFSKFQGPRYPQTENVDGRCGSVHNPPNARQEYDRSNPSPQQSDCLDWNPDSLGNLSGISCQNWGCGYQSDSNNADLNYMVWNWQNLPGMNNTKTYQGEQLRNWWDIHGDFDNVMANDKKLTR